MLGRRRAARGDGPDGVDRQVVSPTPVFFSYDQPADAAAARSPRIFNDLALEIAAPAPHRLVPFCQVPLQDTGRRLPRAGPGLAAGHVGVEIGNHVGDRDLDDAGVVTFLQHCAASDVPVFVHPWDMPDTPRARRWMARWLTGMPAETHLSILAMILGGVFDQVDERLRICFAHGGGSFAFWLGRVDNAWHGRRDVVGTSARPPRSTSAGSASTPCVFDAPALRLLVDTLGADHVLLGSDYPYPLGEAEAGTLIRTSPLLTDDERAQAPGRQRARRILGAGVPA